MAKSDGTGLREAVQAGLLDDGDFLRALLERVLQASREAEVTAHLGAARYERSGERVGQRNGHRPRTVQPRVGTLHLLVPQDRAGTLSTQPFARYQRTEKAPVLALMEMDVEGVSTRKVAAITGALCGTSFSKSLVSELAGQLDAALAAWRARPPGAPAYPSLCVDARYEFVRQGGRVVSQGGLVVTGVRADGYREALAVEVADTASAATYQALFRGLKQRGLAGVQLVTSDDHAGLRAAIQRHFQGASWQRCQVHFLRDLLGLVGKSQRKALVADVQLLFAAPTLDQARALAAPIAERWRASHPHLARCLEEDIEACLTCPAFPRAHQPRIRATNGLERFHQELKRRTRVVRIFPNTAACLRLVTALCMAQSDDWISGRRYLDMAPLLAPGHREPAHGLSNVAAD